MAGEITTVLKEAFDLHGHALRSTLEHIFLIEAIRMDKTSDQDKQSEVTEI